MDQLMDLIVQLLLSAGLVCSIGILTTSFAGEKEILWDHGRVAAGSSSFVPLFLPLLTGIQRWIARTVRRKESSDDDADCPSSY
ncbi:hypothetical protein GE107_07130 [Cohnella sp. CFH 77786]|uniref:hypothetical protein n=1 Tax=Cohnella sp. CFH 77786 TaxID=2662265 RepID=UPI001C610D77|nr:hypothetical protein [Cohnella sp. CFH 77786]MBW5445831.1 hypothetical protein [Cohnella sp. CFH 77786]